MRLKGVFNIADHARVDRFQETFGQFGPTTDDLNLRTIGRLHRSSVRSSNPIARDGNNLLVILLPAANLTHAIRVASHGEAETRSIRAAIINVDQSHGSQVGTT